MHTTLNLPFPYPFIIFLFFGKSRIFQTRKKIKFPFLFIYLHLLKKKKQPNEHDLFIKLPLVKKKTKEFLPQNRKRVFRRCNAIIITLAENSRNLLIRHDTFESVSYLGHNLFVS